MVGVGLLALGYMIVSNNIHRFRGVLIAFVALALSAGLAFGAQPITTGLGDASNQADETAPANAADENTDETTDQNTSSDSSSTAGDNCTTDPTALTADELAAMRHGSIVCWAAHQTTWPTWFANHGAFVKCWAHQGKTDAPSCTVAPAAGAPAASDTSTGHGHGQGKGKNNR